MVNCNRNLFRSIHFKHNTVFFFHEADVNAHGLGKMQALDFLKVVLYLFQGSTAKLAAQFVIHFESMSAIVVEISHPFWDGFISIGCIQKVLIWETYFMLFEACQTRNNRWLLTHHSKSVIGAVHCFFACGDPCTIILARQYPRLFLNLSISWTGQWKRFAESLFVIDEVVQTALYVKRSNLFTLHCSHFHHDHQPFVAFVVGYLLYFITSRMLQLLQTAIEISFFSS